MEFPDEGTLKMINLSQGGVRSMQCTTMTVFDNPPNMRFELDNQIHKTIERAAAQQGLDFRTRTSDYQIHSFGHGEFYINRAAKELEEINGGNLIDLSPHLGYAMGDSMLAASTAAFG